VNRAGRESCARDLEAVEALVRVRSGATVVTTSLSYLKYLLIFFDFNNQLMYQIVKVQMNVINK